MAFRPLYPRKRTFAGSQQPGLFYCSFCPVVKTFICACAADRGQHREVAGVSPKLAHGKRLPRRW
jgi:hypothetical protein